MPEKKDCFLQIHDFVVLTREARVFLSKVVYDLIEFTLLNFYKAEDTAQIALFLHFDDVVELDIKVFHEVVKLIVQGSNCFIFTGLLRLLPYCGIRLLMCNSIIIIFLNGYLKLRFPALQFQPCSMKRLSVISMCGVY